MTEEMMLVKNLSERICRRLAEGFTPDSDTLHFILSAFGIGSSELFSFLNDSSLNDGTIYELAIYPDHGFRKEIERELPASGAGLSVIEKIEKNVSMSAPSILIITDGGTYKLDPGSSGSCVSSFIKKLNLETDLSCTGRGSGTDLYYSARALLRRKKFEPRGDRGEFIKRLIENAEMEEESPEEIQALLEKALPLLQGTQDKSIDALAVKKYYYESVISQSGEFASMLKTWGMEFLMMRRIQPSPESVEEAVNTIRVIDRLTRTVYGLIIPPSDIAVQMTIDRGDPPGGLIS